MRKLKFNNILICGHPEQVDVKLLEHAAILAKQNRSRVKVVHVVTDFPRDVKTWWNVRNPGKLRDKIIGERQDFLDGLVETLRKMGVDDVTRELLWGEPAVEITTEVLNSKQDLVMLVSKHSGKISHGALGYFSTDLLRQCPSPIWVAQNRVKKRVKRIFACLSGSGGDVKVQDNNAKILDHAVAVANAEDAKVHVVHVMQLYGGKHNRGKSREGKQLNSDLVAYVEHVRDEILTRCNQYLEASKITLANDQVHLLVGTPTEVIPEFVESKGADLIVMATVARAGIPGLVVGNVAEKVLPKLNCPVLIVKSDEFIAQYNQKTKMPKASVA